MSESKVKEQIDIIEKGTRQANTSKSAALKTLQNAGILTESGELSQLYCSE